MDEKFLFPLFLFVLFFTDLYPEWVSTSLRERNHGLFSCLTLGKQVKIRESGLKNEDGQQPGFSPN